MEVPVIHRINNFQIASSSFPGIQSVCAAYNFCKWSAVIPALVAAFGSIINRIKILILRLRHEIQSLASSNLLSDLDDYSSCSDGEDGSYSSPSTVSSEYEEHEDEQAESSGSFYWRRVDEYFLVRGSGHPLDDQLQSGKVRHRCRCRIGEIFSLSEIANSKSVVKLWDSIGLGLGLDFDDYESSCSAATVLEALVSGEKPSAPAQSSLSSYFLHRHRHCQPQLTAFSQACLRIYFIHLILLVIKCGVKQWSIDMVDDMWTKNWGPQFKMDGC